MEDQEQPSTGLYGTWFRPFPEMLMFSDELIAKIREKESRDKAFADEMRR